MLAAIKRVLWVYLVERLFAKRMRDDFLRVICGPVYFQALSAANQLDLFTLLADAGPLKRSVIQQRLGLSAYAVRSLTSVLGATGVIKRVRGSDADDPTYRNSFIAKVYLNKKSPKSLSSVVDWYHFIVYKPLWHYTDSLRAGVNLGLLEVPGQGETLYERLGASPDLHEIFQHSLEQISAQANQALVDHMPVAGRFLLDVGGGNGSNLVAFAKKHGALRGAVFDNGDACQIARTNIARHGRTDRLSAVAGDCFRDPYPAGVDAILYSHFLDIWSVEQDQFLIRKAYESLPKGGTMMIFDIMERDQRDGPLPAAAGSPYYLTLASGGGFHYSAREFKLWALNAGFRKVERIALPEEHTLIVATK